MSKFPLYVSLMQNIPKTDLTLLQKTNFVRKISELDQNAHELMYALIKSYYIDQEEGDILCVPYSGQLTKSGIEFDLILLPAKLRQLLYRFIQREITRIEQDKEILVFQSPSLTQEQE